MDLDALTYTLTTVDGRPHALWSDGSLLPLIRGGDGGGGSGGEGDGSGSGSDGDAGNGDGSGDGGDTGTGDNDDDAGDSKVEFTPEQQKHLAKVIATERAKAKTAAETAAKKAIEQAAERAKMDEADRLKAEKADADKAAAEATVKANTRLVRSEAKVLAVAEGVDAGKADRFVRVLSDDLGDIKVDDDGEVDAKALRKVVQTTLKDFPEFKASAGNGSGRSGGEMNGNGGTQRATTLEDAVSAKLGG